MWAGALLWYTAEIVGQKVEDREGRMDTLTTDLGIKNSDIAMTGRKIQSCRVHFRVHGTSEQRRWLDPLRGIIVLQAPQRSPPGSP